MKYKLVTVPVVVAAVTLSALTFGTGGSPAGAAPKPPPPPVPWQLTDYGPRSMDNVILKWNEELLEIIRRHPPQTGPTITARSLGVLHTATYDAWAAYDAVAKGTRLGSTLRRPAAERTLANKDKAISFAAYRVLVDLFPAAQHARMNEVDLDGRMTELGYDPADTSTDTTTPQGIGNVVATAVLDYRHADGSNQLGDKATGAPDPTKRYADYTGYTPKNQWNSDPLVDKWAWQPLCVPLPPPGATTCGGAVQKAATPQWGSVLMFSALPASSYRVTGPPKNPDGTYSTVDIDQEISDAANLDDAKKAKAEYWADGPASEFPPGHDFIFAQAVSRKRAYTLDQDVKTFFALGNAMLDASIASWWQKYRYDYVRPITAIREHKRGQLIPGWKGPNQGFGLVKGEEWTPYQAANVVTPPFPEYVSGHSTFSGAGAAILFSATGSDAFGASVTIKQGTSKFESNTPSADVTFTWPTFSDTGTDAGLSRRIGGIHFQTGDMHGRALGRQVGAYVWAKAQEHISGRAPG